MCKRDARGTLHCTRFTVCTIVSCVRNYLITTRIVGTTVLLINDVIADYALMQTAEKKISKVTQLLDVGTRYAVFCNDIARQRRKARISSGATGR